MQYNNYYCELKAAVVSPHFWIYLGWNDIKQRYRRSVLGPLWLVINTAVFVGMLGVLWSTLFKTRLDDYLPFFCIGYVLWQLVSSQITDCAAGFTQFEYIIKQIRLPFPVYVLRLLTRNFIIFLHNLLVLVVVLVVFSGAHVSPYGVFLALVGMMLLLLTLFSLSTIISLVCTRYKDMTMIVQNALMICFYFTPILWKPGNLPGRFEWVANMNPVYVFIELVRGPLLGSPVSFDMWVASIVMCILMFAISYWLMALKRNNIAYWI